MDERFIDPPQLDASGMPSDNINISDVIEVIETDPDFRESTRTNNNNNNNDTNNNEHVSTMFNGGSEIAATSRSIQAPLMNSRRNAVIRIVEQPAPKGLRFRYECEGRSAGSIPGTSSTPENKTFPTIKIDGYQGKAVVVVSCVTKDKPYRPHPHNLVGREGCKKGICTLPVPTETMTLTFSNLGIQCVKKRDIEPALKQREEIKVDPFRTGFMHRNQPTSIDLNVVRLCFQAFLESAPDKYTVPIRPVVSEPIYDKKAMSDLIIVKLSHCVCPVDGGRNDIIILCEKVAKEDIKVRFFEEKDGQLVWEATADFQPSQVHKQTAIWFKPPRYHKLDITEPVRVSVQMQRPSDGATSEPVPFEYLPLDAEPCTKQKRKRIHFDSVSNTNILHQLQEQERNRNVKPEYNLLNIPVEEIKTEPRDTSPSPYGGGIQAYGNVSPMYNNNPGVSPHYQTLDPLLQPSTSGISYNLPYATNYQQQQQQQPLQPLPPFSNVMNQTNWNITSSVTATGGTATLSCAGALDQRTIVEPNLSSSLGNLYNLDTQQLSHINSDDLAMYTNNLSETLTNTLLLNDDIPTINSNNNSDQNMSDSLTSFANRALEEM